MFGVFSATLSPMLVVFLYMLIGFILNKKKLLPENAGTVLSKLENYVFVPSLVLNTFMSQCTTASFKEYYPLILYSLAALAIAILIAVPLGKLFSKNDYYKQNIYTYSLVFANFGFLGNAVVPILFGANDPQILYKYMLFTLPLQVAVYSWGIAILIPKGQKNKTPLSGLNNPTFYSIVFGIILGISGITKCIPEFVMQTLSTLASCMAPVAMVLTGFIVGGYSMKSLLYDRKVYIAIFLRLFVIPSVVIAMLYFLGASRFILTLVLFAYATPIGMNTIVFPAAYGGETKTSASMVMISHVLCIITLPIMYAIFSILA